MADAARSHEVGQWSTGPSFSDQRVPTDTSHLVAGQTFGPYRIGRLLGRGGMGEVYEAEHVVNRRRVALKILSQRLRREADRARFRFEGELAASISHPHVVYIFGSEEIDGIPAITMELLPGGTLKDRVKANGPLSPTEAVEAILQVIAGLEAAEAAGILHRDIKPSNCFIAHDGKVKVGDFGLSISLLPRGVTFPDEAGAFQGTPEFASPEQLRGEELNVRADIYAVGATLFYLLTGHPPFDGRDPANVVARIAAGPAPSARRFKRAMPR
jgi:serine/threonine protein kinase